MKFAITPMSVGEILSRGVSLLFGRLGVFLAIEFFVVTPTLVLELALPDLAVGVGALLFILPMIILGPIGSAAMLHVIAQEYMGQPVSLSEAIKFGMGRFVPLLGTSILAGLGIGFGMMCCVPGIYLWIIWIFVSQVVVMESISGPEALGRSKDLVSGYFWQVFGVMIILVLIVAMISGPVNVTLSLALPFQNPAQVNPNNPFQGPEITSYPNFAINVLASTAINAIGQIFTAICTTLLYFDLRNRKEAFDVEHIVRWMDQYRDWRDEPAPGEILPGDMAAQTGIKEGDAALPPISPPRETGIRSEESGARDQDSDGKPGPTPTLDP